MNRQNCFPRLVAVLFLFFSSISLCQLPTDEPYSINSGTQFNKRGGQGESISFLLPDYTVDNYNGNLKLTQSKKFELPNDLSFSMDLLYHSNIDHVYFPNDGTKASSSGQHINAPEWVLGIKGFAVQALNFESFLHTNTGTFQNVGQGSSQPLFGDQTAALISGYHYTNSLQYYPANVPDAPARTADQLVLLKSDGSKLELYNTYPTTRTRGTSWQASRIGTYIEPGRNNINYAIVRSTTNGSCRDIYYKAGDGLTYHFREDFVDYILDNAYAGKYDENNSVWLTTEMKNKTKVAYLIEIIAPEGDKLIFSYDFVGFSIDENNPWGRKLFKKVQYQRPDGGLFDLISLSYISQSTILEKPKIFLKDHVHGANFEISLGSYKYDVSLIGASEKIGNQLYTNSINITSIKDASNNKVEYNYCPTFKTQFSRNFRTTQPWMGSVECRSKIVYPIFPITDFKLNGKTVKFEYWDTRLDHTSASPDVLPDPSTDWTNRLNYLNLSSPEIDMPWYWWKTFDSKNMNYCVRDNRTTLMIKSTIERHDEVDQVKTLYTYNWEPKEHDYLNPFENETPDAQKDYCKYDQYLPWDKKIKNIKTEVLKTDLLYSSNTAQGPEKVKNIYSYDLYKTSEDFGMNMYESRRQIKLSSIEKINLDKPSIKEFEEYKYDVTSSVTYYSGSFDLIFKFSGVKINDISPPFHFWEWYSHTEAELDFPTEEGGYPIKKYYYSSKTVEKPEVFTLVGMTFNKQATYFKHFIPDPDLLTNPNSENQLYRTYLPAKYIESSDTEGEISREENTYFSFEHQFRGKLQTGTMFGKVNSAGLIRKREINYDYCNDNVYYGLVKSITYDDGKKISYNYQGQGGVESSVVAKVLQRDGQIKTKQFKHFLYQIYPFKSTVSVTPSNSYSFYTAYNFAGDLLYRVDENQYYSKYEYDSKHRLVAEYNPGSFLDDRNVSAVDTLRSEKKISLAITISDDGKEYIEKTLNMSENPQTSNNTPMQSEDGINRIAESEEGEANSLISYKAFVFLDDPIDLTDVTNVNNAKITVSMKDADLGGRSGIHVFCKAVSKSLSEQNNQYTTIADSVFQFTDGKGELIFDVKSILTTAKLAGSKVFGFKFYLEKPSAGEAAVKLAFDAENLPTIEYDLEKYSSVLASTNYKYVDNYYIPKVTANVTLEFGDGESKKVYSTEHGFRGGSLESYVKFIPFGQNTFESTKKINFLGLPIVQKTGEGISQYSYYDGFGKLSKTTYDKNITGSSITREYNMDASTWNLVYFTETYTDADGKKIESTYDWKESLISKKQGDLPAATFQYNLLKQLVQVNTPGGKIIKYGYDDWGIINSKQTPDGGLEKYKLDRFGRQRFLINADAPQNSAKITFLRYDILGQVIAAGEISSTQYSYDELDPDFSYAAGANHFENMESDFSNFFVVNMYDSYVKTGAFANLDDPAESIVEKNRIGRLVAVAFRDKLEDPWNYKVYSYDAQGNVLYYYIKFRSTAWKKIENKYDHAGNLVKQSVNPENPQESIFYWYEYNDLGKLTGTFSSKIDNYSTAIKDFTMEYNKDAKIKKITYPYISNMANNFLSFNYQNRGLISALSGGFTSGLSYNLNGNLSSAFYTVYNGSSYQFSYFYDSANRLIYVNNQDVLFENFSYDADGNILLKKSLDEQITFNYSQTNNRLSSIKKNDDPNLKYYSYDYCGRMVEDQNRGISGISYRYSDQMLSYTQNGHEFSYSYDDEGNRIYKSNQDEFSLIDNFGKEIAVYDFTRGKVKYFNLFALGLNGRIETSFLSPDNRDDKRFYYMKDHLGSVRRTYTAEGELVYTNEYSAFGGSLNSYNTGGAIHNDYFTGKIKDTETGYNYFGARFYDSQICRWLTPDPLSDDTPEFNPYNYCVNNPVNYKDPSGLDSSDTQDNDVDIMLPDLFEYPKTFFVDGKKIPSSTAIPTSETIGSASNVSPKKDEIDIQGVVISVAGLAAGETAKTLFDANQKTFFDFISWSKQKFSSRSIKKMNIKVLKSKSLAGKVKILGFVLSGVSLYLNYRDYGKTQDNYVHCQLIFDASFNFIGAFSPVVGVSYSIGKVMGQKITETEGYKYFRDNLYVPSERMHRDFYGKYPQLQAIDWMGVK